MPEIIEITVYRLDELSERAKENARAWYRETGLDYEWYHSAFEDFERICAILGISLKSNPVRLYGGGTRAKPCIYFNGFWNQGDGASYEGSYAYAKDAHTAIRRHAPQDTELHQIADTLRDVQRRNFYQLRADVTQGGHYYHEYSMTVSVERDSGTSQEATADVEEIVTEALRDLARWLYRSLRDEYDHLSSDEAVDDTIRANGYGFTAAGRRFAGA